DLGNLDLWCPRDLVVTYAQHYWLSDSIGDHVILTMISNTIGKPGTGKRQDGLNGVKERPVPVVFEDAPAALDRIVLTMVWRVIGQAQLYGIRPPTPAQPLHKLRAPTLIVRAIIQIDDQRGNVRKALTDRPPPRDEPIHETITGHFGGDAIHKQLIQRREKDADGRHSRLRLKLMVRRINLDPTLPPTGEGADFADGFGIHRDLQDVIRLISAVMHGGDLCEDRVGCGDFFCG